MAERSSERNAAVLVGLDFGAGGYAEGIEELGLLVASAGIRTRGLVRGRRDRPDPAHFAGSGKVEEIRRALREQGASLAIFNHVLSPVQERNLEKALGGRGFLGGMGETQLEVDRRLIATRIKVLKDKLGKLQRRREVQRRARARGRSFSVSLVGYTKAGKSTLFNTLTHAGALAEDRLFATLDTTTRRLYLPEAGNVTISDTVGFIRDLPHTLVAAFRATLEETIHADLLLHVV